MIAEVETAEVETAEVGTVEVEESQIVSKKTGLANHAITAISHSEPNVIDVVKKRETVEVETAEVDSNDVMIVAETAEVETAEVETVEVDSNDEMIEAGTAEVETVEVDSNDEMIEAGTAEVETVEMDSNDEMIEAGTAEVETVEVAEIIEEVVKIEIVNKHEMEIGTARVVGTTISLSELNVTAVGNQRAVVDRDNELKDEKAIEVETGGLGESQIEEMIHDVAQETIRTDLIIVEAKGEAVVRGTTGIETDADYA
ncbi:MAG: hypothetical protein QGH13_03410 [Candidatus Thalassarchaeaceae archaeon]|nr:hypothetical protein [Candidatus Thalassarchaeaceae archaeon]